MKPEFKNRKAINVLGLMEYFTPDNEDYEGIWKRFMAYHGKINNFSTDKAYYGVYFYTDGEKGLDYIAGMSVEGVDEVPEGLTLREVPAAYCAVFECTVKTIGQTYDNVFKNWLPASKYEQENSRQTFERYPPDTKTGDDVVLIYVPVRKKNEVQ
ncbi:hypothetical protein GF312_16595 [Candidatus Poribacteria bacterium]|nr:hypothetical protein [Candidatus Poribacteria bacterium]